MTSREGLPSPDHGRRLYSAKTIVREWLTIGDQWLQPDAEYRDEPHLRWLEAELSKDIETAAAEGKFSDEDKIRLRDAFGEGTRRAADPEVDERIRRVIESF
jgi:hypothetical protein